MKHWPPCRISWWTRRRILADTRHRRNETVRRSEEIRCTRNLDTLADIATV